MSRLFPCLSVLVLAMLSVAATAGADPIDLNGSVQSLSSQALRYTLSGDGFSITGTAGDFGSFESCYVSPCFLGGAAPLNLFLGGDIGGGSGTINGTFYPFLAVGGNLRFTGSAAVSGSGSTLVLTAAFSLVDSSLHAASVLNRDVDLFNVPVTGHGIATLTLHEDMSIPVPGAYSFTSLRYDFGNGPAAVTPEPASILLLGSGIGLAALRALRQRRRAGTRT